MKNSSSKLLKIKKHTVFNIEPVRGSEKEREKRDTTTITVTTTGTSVVFNNANGNRAF